MVTACWSVGPESPVITARKSRGFAEIDFADLLARAGAHQVDGLHEILVVLHVFFALVARQVVGNAADDREMPVLAIGAVEYDAVRVDQIEFVAVARESDGSALGQLHANTIRQNALHAGGFDPGQLLQFAAALVQRNLQYAAIAVA